jgi:hypothetical protein
VIIARRLSKEEFSACFAQPMSDVTAHANAAVDIWPYVDALDLDELGIPSINDVHYVYRDAAVVLIRYSSARAASTPFL